LNFILFSNKEILSFAVLIEKLEEKPGVLNINIITQVQPKLTGWVI